MVRGGKEGREYGPLLVITYLIDIMKSCVWKEMKILVIVAPKGPCKRIDILESFKPRKGYVMVW